MRVAAVMREEPNPLPPVPVILMFRCRRCDKLLGEYAPPVGYMKIVCPRCGAWNVLATKVAA